MLTILYVCGLLRHNLDFYELGFGRISDSDLLGEQKKLVVVMAVVGSATRVSHGSGLVLRWFWRVVGLWRK